ncbi:MAG: hypothetical protein WC813_00875 [Patescibacteria group bacterium]|jgi:hypothetical protein
MLTMILCVLTNFALATGPAPTPPAATEPAPAVLVEPPDEKPECKIQDACTEAELAAMKLWMADMDAWRARMGKPSATTVEFRKKVAWLCAQHNDCLDPVAAAPAVTRPPVVTPVEPPKKTPLEQLKGIVTGTPKPDEGGTRPSPDMPTTIDPTPTMPSATATGGQATATNIVETVEPATTVEPGPSSASITRTVTEADGPRLGPIAGIEFVRQAEIRGVTAPSMLTELIGASLRLGDSHGPFVSGRGAGFVGSEGAQGALGGLTIGAGLDGLLEFGVLSEFYVYEVRGAGERSNPYVQAKYSGLRNGLSLSLSPGSEDRVLLTASGSVDLFHGRVETKDGRWADLSPTLGLSLTWFPKISDRTETVTVTGMASDSKPPRGQEVPLH